MLIFAVVVPTFKRKELLARCLKALSSQYIPEEAPFSYKICVSDDARDDELASFLQQNFPQVLYVKGPQKGPAANRNNGARALPGDWICFIDDDCIPEIGLLAAYHKAILDCPSVSALEGRIFADREQERFDEESPVNKNGGCFWSCNVALRRDTFEVTGGFDEDYIYAAYEDIDYLKRLVKQGFFPMFIPEAAVCHPWRRWQAWRRFMRQRRSSLIYLKKHPDSEPAFHAWILFKITVGRLLYNTFPGVLRYKGRGFLTALGFDFLELMFVFYRVFCQMKFIKSS